MAEWTCAWDDRSSLDVEDKLDKDGEVEIGIYNEKDEYHHLFLTKEHAREVAEHILHLLEESK